MMWFLIATLVLLGAIFARAVWSHRLNPVLLGVLVWAPAMFLATSGIEFLSPLYDHLNHPMSPPTLSALAISFASFSAGVIAVLLACGPHWESRLHRNTLRVHDTRLALLFVAGLAVFLYSFSRSGLSGVMNLAPEEVLESRLSLHLGPLSFVVLFMDVAAVIFFCKLLETRRYMYGLPLLLAMACQMATLQKSKLLFLVLGALFACLLLPKAARNIFLGSWAKRAVVLVLGFTVIGAFFAMNALRGIGVIQMTTAESPLVEQVYIYSGATAILNLSSAVEGRTQMGAPTYGLVLARPVTWHLVDRAQLGPTRNFEGINAATYLIYPWSDFRWLGFLITPFLTGALITFYFWLALGRTAYGIVFGTLAFEAVVLSVNTDVIFDPTTAIIMAVAVLTHIFVRQPARREAVPRLQSAAV